MTFTSNNLSCFLGLELIQWNMENRIKKKGRKNYFNHVKCFHNIFNVESFSINYLTSICIILSSGLLGFSFEDWAIFQRDAGNNWAWPIY